MPSSDTESETVASPQAPSGPQHSPQRSPGRGLNPFVIAGAAFAVGIVIAKVIDWRGHAHPRR